MPVMVQVSELSYADADGIRVLDDIHLHVEREEMIVITGPAVAGKSTLLRLLAAQITPQTGQILVHGRNIARLSRHKAIGLRRRIGYMPHSFPLLDRTVLENLTFKLRALGDFREQAEERALVALEDVGLTARLATPIAELDAADRIRTGLAVTICNEPLLLLIDEPFADLAPEDREAVGSVLSRVHARGRTTIIATRGPAPTSLAVSCALTLTDGRMEG
ncbi:MAG: ATP-binding cassette domain-containing protein [Candidatus Bipolaricaulota bacterium]|nr:MAG: ATP-binding cassette domain-containing protein [Candidatus Bipolaricaulota bacterium]